MMKMFSQLFPKWPAVGVLLLLLAACHKSVPEPDAVLLPAELKAYTLFEPGTYWIYQDSATHQLDSVWVESVEKKIFRERLGGSGSSSDLVIFKYEDFTMRTRSAQSGREYMFSLKRNCGLPYREDQGTKGPCWIVERSRYQPTSTLDAGGEQVFPYSIDRDKTMFLVANSAIMYPYWHIRPLLLNGSSYDNVMEVKLSNNASEGGWPTHYYWVPGKGIVLQRIRQNGTMKTWQLLRSHIVQ